MNEKIRATHVERRAIVYLRQSTLKQVHEHHESTARQYALRQRALELGWPPERIDTLDEDMGQSGASASWRAGFQRLAEDVARGRVGAILSLEVSRLARSSADWHRLLELCALADVLIADEDSVYSPRDYNDRLLLGLKGTMSEAEQYWMRLRLQGGRLSKARRGELFLPPPVGYQWDEATHRLRLDPDEQVQRMVHLVFERFRMEGSAFAVMRYFERNGLKMPVRDQSMHQVRWGPARHGTMLQMLHNPAYAGAYVFGRREEHLALVDGQLKRRRIIRMPQEEWKVCLRDHHPAYISWEEYLANQKKLHENRSNSKLPDQRGAAREGHALLQGLVLCGRCGHRMQTRYHGLRRHAYYECRSPTPEGGDKRMCWMVAAAAIDEVIARLFLEVTQPPEIELGLAVAREVERQVGEVHHQWKLRLERVRYEAQLAERRYKAIDPDNRVVARTLEREWNDRLRELEETEHEYQEVLQREKLELTDKDRARILALAKDLSCVWHAKSTTHAERKNLLRILVREVTLNPIEVPERMTRIQVVWQTGAVSDLSVPRRTRFEARKTSAEAVECIRMLFEEKKSDDEIAAELNRRGLRSGVERPWDAKAVRWVRWRHGFHRVPVPPQAGRQPTRRADGLYSVRGVAEHFNVTKWMVYYWIKEGWLKGVEGGGMGRCWWFKLDSQTIKRLTDAKARGYGPGGRSHSKAHLQEEGHYA